MAQEPAGPIGRAVARHAAALAARDAAASPQAVARDTSADSDAHWSHVRLLPSGTDIIVTVSGEEPYRRTFQAATDSEIAVLDSHKRTQRFARNAVTEVTVLTSHGSVPAAVALAGLGAFVGITIAERLALSVRCQPSCGGVEAAMVLSVVGIPVAAGIAGFHLAKQWTRDVIYRGP